MDDVEVFDAYIQNHVKVFDAYIQNRLDETFGGDLPGHRKNQLKNEILAGISTLSDSALEEWVDAIDATVKAQCIGVRALHRMSERAEMIPRDRVWMLYDPCVITKWRDEETANRFHEFVRRNQEGEKAEARKSRHACAKRKRELVESAYTEPGGRTGELIDRVAGLFATGLVRELNTARRIESSANPPDDWELVEGGDSGTRPASLSGLFAKWTPTPGGMHDRALGIASLINKKLLELLREDGNRALREEMMRSSGVPIENLSLQRDVLTPLRRVAEIPEHFVGAGTVSGGVNYGRMASRCRMIFGEKVFRRLDRENYDRYLLEAAKTNLLRQLKPFCKDGRIAKVNAGVLLPHEVVLKAVQAKSSLSIARVEAQLQWQALLDSFARPVGSDSRRLIIPMCDVSGSMCCPCGDSDDGTCMDVACALSLLLTDLLPEESAFRGKVLTFSESPEFVDVMPESKSTLTIEAIEAADSLDSIVALLPDLAGRINTLKGSDWGMSTNFFEAMERICDIAKEHNLTSEDVGGLELVVFSDMEFNQAQCGANYCGNIMLEKIRELFVDRFGPQVADPPKIVFWNLRASTSGSGIAETAEEDGMALLSGFSAGMVRKYLTWDLVSSGVDEVSEIGGAEGAGSRGVQELDKGKVTPMKAMLACLEDPLYNNLRIEKDLEEWEVLISEEEIMKRAEMVLGENGEPVYTSNSSALVAFFFEALPGIEASEFKGLLDAAFKENPMIALKLLFNLGSVRKSTAGKADRENFQLGLLWLWRTWPQTYLLNITSIAKFASLKELLNSAMFIVYEGECERDPVNYALYSLAGQKKALMEHQMRKKCRNDKVRRKCRKMQRLKLWCDFARSDEKDLFGELRVEHDFTQIMSKLQPKVMDSDVYGRTQKI